MKDLCRLNGLFQGHFARIHEAWAVYLQHSHFRKYLNRRPWFYRDCPPGDVRGGALDREMVFRKVIVR
jgi:hypothetical protein